MALYAYIEDDINLEKIYNKFNEESLSTLIPQLVMSYKKSDYKMVDKYIKKINNANEHFLKFLKDDINITEEDLSMDGYYSPGDKSEVIMYVENYTFFIMGMAKVVEFLQNKGR